MTSLNDKVTVIGAINEVRRKSKIGPAAAVDTDSDSLLKLMYLNDVVAEIGDFGNWQEMYAEAIVSVQSSVRDYAVSGVNIQSIEEIALSTQQSALTRVDLDVIRQLQRINGTGAPNQWALKGVDSAGNPVITFDRWPTDSDDGYFNIAYYQRAPVYATADASAQIPFPGRVVVQGLLTKTILDESDGEPTSRYQSNMALYQNMTQETYNRFNGDTGGDAYFQPGKRRK